MANIKTNEHGELISSEDRESWLQARLTGVTATEAGKILANKSSREKLLKIKLGLETDNFLPNEAMLHGIKREPHIAKQIEKMFGATPNQFLFHHQKYVHHLATPDGIADDFVVEIKATKGDMDENIKRYYNQMQWQMHVLNKDLCLFVIERHENFTPVSVRIAWVERDDIRVADLVKAAEGFLHELTVMKASII